MIGLLFAITNNLLIRFTTILDTGINWPSEHLSFLDPLLEGLQASLVPILIVAGTAGSIYAVILGVNMARAETADKREEAKKRIINTIVAMIITVVLILIFYWFIGNVPEWFGEGGAFTPSE